MTEYAGDEVSAIVLDPGSSTTRAGFAGEDTPKSILPTSYAVQDSKRWFGDHVIDMPREDVAVKNPYSRDGIVEDWDAAEELWKQSFASKLTGIRPNRALEQWLNAPESVPNLQKAMAEAEDTERALEDHPLFLSEPNWNPTKNREKAAELVLENWAAPAFYTSKSSVLAAFGMGKSSALVIDVGASQLSIAAVHDGMILKKSITRSHLGGNYLTSQARNIFASHDPPVTINPHYVVHSKAIMDTTTNTPSPAVLKPFPEGYKHPQESFRRYQEDKIVLEFKEHALQTWLSPSMPFRGQGEATARDQYGYSFEFADGYSQLFTSDRFKIVETLFDAQCHTTPPTGSSEIQVFPAPEQNQTIPGLVKMCLSQCDVDLRPMLLSNVVITGSGSLIKGFPDRISGELSRMYPTAKIRVAAAGMAVERKFGSWIGGSIVASLGTFHQMWISKKEYDEHGPSIVEKRCK